MKRFLCAVLCAAMMLSAAACGKADPVGSTAGTETEKETETTTEAAPKTDKEAKPEDVVKEALNALMKKEARFAFDSEAVLDISLPYQAPEGTESDDDFMALIGQIIGVLSGDEKELNIRLEPKIRGAVDMQKGMTAEGEIKNNLSEPIARLTEMLGGEGAESLVPELTDNIKLKAYLDKEEGKLYYGNPETDTWNYLTADLSDDPETIESLKLNEIFGDDYEWKVTDTQYVLEVRKNLQEAALNAITDEDQMQTEEKDIAEELKDAELHISMIFNDEKKLESAELSLDSLSVDLNELIPGLGFKLNAFSVKMDTDYAAAVDFEVPKDVKENAQPVDQDEPVFPVTSEDYPWINDNYSLNDVVITDDSNITLTAKEAQNDEEGNMQVLFTLENKTDKTITIDLDDMYLNGLKCSELLYEDVDPKSSKDLVLTVYSFDMEDILLEHAYQMDLFLEIGYSDDWEADPLLSGQCTLTLQPGKAVTPQADPQMTLVESDKLNISWVEAAEPEGSIGADLYLYCVNGTDAEVYYEVTNLSVNGHEVDDLWWGDNTKPGFAGFCSYYLPSSFMKTNGIDTIDSIQGTIRAYKEVDWEEVEYGTNDFTVSYGSDGSVSVETAPAK